MNREALGRAVRDAWVARQQLKHEQRHEAVRYYASWEELTEFERETDRLIAEAVVAAAQKGRSS